MTRVPGADQRGERGSAAVLVAAACAVLLVLGSAAALVAAAAYSSAKARSAADLSALAGAAAGLDTLLGRGGADPCAAAAAIAARNGASLVSCGVDGTVNVSVVVAVAFPGSALWWSGLPDARASARAGPAPPAPRS